MMSGLGIELASLGLGVQHTNHYTSIPPEPKQYKTSVIGVNGKSGVFL